MKIKKEVDGDEPKVVTNEPLDEGQCLVLRVHELLCAVFAGR